MSTFTKILLALGIAILSVLIVGFLAIYFLSPDRYNVLIVGSDQRGTERSRSDVLMVFSIPKSPTEEIAVITIPRDSKVPVEGHGEDKITHAYVYGEVEEGSQLGNIDLTRQTVEDFLDIKTQATVEVTFETFQEIVDLLGGADTSQGHLEGSEALEIVRNRYRDGGDFARTADQREVLMSLVSKLKQKDNALAVYDKFQSDPQARLWFSKIDTALFLPATAIVRGGSTQLGEIHEDVIPGAGDYQYSANLGQNLYFWIPDRAGTDQIVADYLK